MHVVPASCGWTVHSSASTEVVQPDGPAAVTEHATVPQSAGSAAEATIAIVHAGVQAGTVTPGTHATVQPTGFAAAAATAGTHADVQVGGSKPAGCEQNIAPGVQAAGT